MRENHFMIHFPQKINYVPQFLKQWDSSSFIRHVGSTDEARVRIRNLSEWKTLKKVSSLKIDRTSDKLKTITDLLNLNCFSSTLIVITSTFSHYLILLSLQHFIFHISSTKFYLSIYYLKLNETKSHWIRSFDGKIFSYLPF